MPRASLTTILHHLRRLAAGDTVGLPDRELLARFTAGREPSAFEALVERHGPMVWGVCRRVLGRCPDAEDAFQATFLVLARKAGSLRQPEAVGCWLYGVAHRIAVRARATAARRGTGELPPEMAGRAPDPLDEVSGRELCALLDEELNRLPARFRDPLVLCCLQGRARDEAARALGWSLGTLKRRLEQGRVRLRGRLARRGLALPAALLTLEVTGPAEAVPPALAAAAARAALSFASGEAAAGTVSAGAVTLAEGALQSVPAARMPAVLALALALAVTAAGAGLFFHPSPQAPESAPPIPDVGKPKSDLFGDPLPDGAVARIGTTRLAHNQPIGGLSFSADGKLLASSDWGEVRLWDVASGRELRRWKGANPALSPDGKVLVFDDPPPHPLEQGATLTLCIADTATGKTIRRPLVRNAEEGRIQTGGTLVAFSPDGKRFAWCVAENVILHLCDAGTGEELWHKRLQHEGWENNIFAPLVRGLAFSPDGKILVAVCPDEKQAVEAIDTVTGRTLRQFSGSADLACAFSPDGKYLAASGRDAVQVWETATWKEKPGFESNWHGDGTCLGFSAEGKDLIVGTCYSFGQITVLDLATGKALCNSELTKDQPFDWTRTPQLGSVALAANGKVAAWGLGETNPGWIGQAFGHRIHLRDPATGKELWPVGDQPQASNIFATTPDGKAIAAPCLDGNVRLWDTATGKELQQFVGGKGELRFLRFSPDGKELIAAWDQTGTGIPNDVRAYFIWDAATGKERRRFVSPQGYCSRCTELSPDGKLLAEGEFELNHPCKVRWYDLATGNEVGTSDGAHEDFVQSLAFSADGLLLASAGRDAQVRVWELATGKQRSAFPQPRKPDHDLGFDFCQVAFTADGKTLLASQRGFYPCEGEVPGRVQPGNCVVLWDLDAGKPRCRHENPVKDATSTTYYPEENVLAFKGHMSGKIHLWDPETGREVSGLKRPALYADGMVFRSDGSPLATRDADGTILIWDLTGPALKP
jgi:RNA polymerase sigma factor (sigma-70 family)